MLLVRATYPMWVLLVVTAITVGYLARGYGPGPVFAALVVAFVSAASVGPRWRTYPLPLAVWLVVVWVGPSSFAIGLAAWLLILVAVAEAIRQRRSVAEARNQRREAMAREAHAEQQRRATAARLSIARELHDVLAHSLSMINVQAGVTLELLDQQPERVRPALTAIKEGSRQAISDVHALVEALRTDTPEPTAPTAGISDLTALVAAARATGLTVDTAVTGDVHPVPAVVDAAAARIVQESLTNVVRHSAATSASVDVGYGAVRLTVDVTDDGPPRRGTETAGGNGIAGMRERVHALGGQFGVRRTSGGGYHVHAEFGL